MQQDFQEWIETTIARVGHAVIGVGGDRDGHLPNFNYSVGLQQSPAQCELIIAALPPQLAKQLINDMACKLRAGEVVIETGTLVEEVIANYPIRLKVLSPAVAEKTAYAALSRAGEDGIRLVQMEIPDKHGLFPGDPGCDLDYVAQQDFDRFILPHNH